VRLDGIRVLVVDDSRAVLDALVQTLEESGAQATAGFPLHIERPVALRTLIGVVTILALEDDAVEGGAGDARGRPGR